MRVTQLHVRDGCSVKQYAYLEDTNLSYRSYMEDNHVAEDSVVDDKSGLFAILDGHGGRDVSQYCAKNMPIVLREEWEKEGKNVRELLRRVCVRLDEDMKNGGFSSAGEMGSTCCMVLVREYEGRRWCHIANLGDTRAVICTDKSIARRVSIDHKVSNPSETDRIVSEGGTILKGRVAGQLAITRALGDLQLKQYGVSNIPDYDQFEITEQTKYMIVASDGLWDVCEDQKAIQLCKNAMSAKEMVGKLVQFALNNYSRDNISCLVLKF